MKGLILVASWLFLTLSSAAPASNPPESRYRVELVVLEHRDEAAADAVPAPDIAVTPRAARALPPADPARSARLPRRLLAEELRLARLLESRIALAGDRRVLGALGWQLGPRALRAGRMVRMDGELPGVAGFVRLRLATKLVAELDLRWAPQEATDPKPRVFRLRERRSIRLNELHLFDHPAFAVLLYIEREEAPEESALPPRRAAAEVAP